MGEIDVDIWLYDIWTLKYTLYKMSIYHENTWARTGVSKSTSWSLGVIGFSQQSAMGWLRLVD